MPIKFDSEKKVFKLDTVNSSYIMEVFDGGHIVSLYYGAPIPDTDDLDGRRRVISRRVCSRAVEFPDQQHGTSFLQHAV